jgi:hypothetical protein
MQNRERVVLSTGDVVRVTGIAPMMLNRWCLDGLIQPLNEGQGTGVHRVFTLMETIAVAAGVRYREEGARPERVHGVVRLLGSMTLERFEQHLSQGETFPVPACLLDQLDEARPACWLPGMMIVPPPDLAPGLAALMAKLDLGRICQEVKAKVEQLKSQPRTKRGRKKRHRAS